jgi:Cytochrome C'
MRTMRAALAQIGEFAKGDGAQPDALDAAAKVVTLAKSIPSIFPPGSELTELPTKTGAPPTTWSDVERFLDAEAIGRQQAKSASSWRRPNRAALSSEGSARNLAWLRGSSPRSFPRRRDRCLEHHSSAVKRRIRTSQGVLGRPIAGQSIVVDWARAKLPTRPGQRPSLALSPVK